MKKTKIVVAALLLAGSSLVFSSCIGSFQMTHRVLSWNKQIGNKFANELVFVCFCILPVYGVTLAIDALVMNSIEFWSGTNPMEASNKIIETETGKYSIDCDGKGYTITHLDTDTKTRLEFIEDSNSWAIEDQNGELLPFMTFIDDNHVKMLDATGEFQTYELSSAGVMAYTSHIGILPMAQN